MFFLLQVTFISTPTYNWSQGSSMAGASSAGKLFSATSQMLADRRYCNTAHSHTSDQHLFMISASLISHASE